MAGRSDQPTEGPDSTLNYQSVRHVPKHDRPRAVMSAVTGVASACLAAVFGFGAGASLLADSPGTVGLVSSALCICLGICAWILFRQANDFWGWVG